MLRSLRVRKDIERYWENNGDLRSLLQEEISQVRSNFKFVFRKDLQDIDFRRCIPLRIYGDSADAQGLVQGLCLSACPEANSSSS